MCCRNLSSNSRHNSNATATVPSELDTLCSPSLANSSSTIWVLPSSLQNQYREFKWILWLYKVYTFPSLIVLKLTINAEKKWFYPERRLGRRCFNRDWILLAKVSSNAIRPNFADGAPFKIDFKESISAFQAASKVSSGPEWAAAIATDWPIKATQGTSWVLEGPCPEIRALTAAKLRGSEAAWSTLLITPTVRVPAEIDAAGERGTASYIRM